MSRGKRGRRAGKGELPQTQEPREPMLQVQSERSITTRVDFQGPLPPPDILVQYNEASPGAADRIIALAEKQSEHRMHLEKTVVEGDSRRASWGMGAGFTLSVLMIAAAGYMAYAGAPWAGVSLGGLNIATLAGVFVYGTRSRRAERSGKDSPAQQTPGTRRASG